MNKKVSIIVPVYNSEKYLKKCLDSILNQNYKNIEVLVIDDGSNDNSLDIIHEASTRDKRIIVIEKKNGGVSSARNEGLTRASGDYIGFVDSDDYIKKEMYEELVLNLELHNADIVECGYIRVNKDYTEEKHYKLEDKITEGSYECSKEFLSKINTTNFSVNKIYKKYIFDNLEFPNYSYSEDYFLNTKAFYKCTKKVSISTCYYYYYTNEKSAIYRPFSSAKIDGVEVGEVLVGFHKERYSELQPFISLYIVKYILNIYLSLNENSTEDYEKYNKLLKRKFYENFWISNKVLITKKREFKVLINIWIFFFSPNLFCLYKNYRSK
jgi:glycosyltransferase involved in cell wall biosynthesis